MRFKSDPMITIKGEQGKCSQLRLQIQLFQLNVTKFILPTLYMGIYFRIRPHYCKAIELHFEIQ